MRYALFHLLSSLLDLSLSRIYTLHSTLCSVFLPCALNFPPYTLHPALYTHRPTLRTIHHTPYIMQCTIFALHWPSTSLPLNLSLHLHDSNHPPTCTQACTRVCHLTVKIHLRLQCVCAKTASAAWTSAQSAAPPLWRTSGCQPRRRKKRRRQRRRKGNMQSLCLPKGRSGPSGA